MHKFLLLVVLVLQLVHGIHGRSFNRDLLHAGAQAESDIIFVRDDGDSPPFSTKCSPPIHPAPSRRDISFETVEESTHNASAQLWRRVMTLPDGNDATSMHQFYERELGRAQQVVWETRSGSDQNTAILQLFARAPTSAGMQGLCGCTSLVVLCQNAFYISHYWETISFDADLQQWGFRDADDALEQSVLTPLRQGVGSVTNRVQESLYDARGTFGDDSVRAFIVGPDKNSNGKRVGYPDQWEKIKNAVGSMIPGLDPEQHADRWQELRYRRLESDNNALWTTATGKVLVKYDDDHPQGSGRNKLSMWVDKTQVYDDAW